MRLRHDPAEHVGRSAGRQRHDHVDRTRRIIVGGAGRRGDAESQHQNESAATAAATADFPIMAVSPRQTCWISYARGSGAAKGQNRGCDGMASALPAIVELWFSYSARVDSHLSESVRCLIAAPRMSRAGSPPGMRRSSPRRGRRRAKAAWRRCRSRRSRSAPASRRERSIAISPARPIWSRRCLRKSPTREIAALRRAADVAPGPLSALSAAIMTFATRALRDRRLTFAAIAEPVDAELDAARLSFRKALAGEFSARIAARGRGRPSAGTGCGAGGRGLARPSDRSADRPARAATPPAASAMWCSR